MIFLGSDHRGYELKEKIKKWLGGLDYPFEDMGAHKLDLDDDYPDFISLVAQEVSKNPENNLGIVLGHSGQGEAIAANKFPGIRAIVFYGGPEEILKLSREHNDANVLSLGASFVSDEDAKSALKLWLETKFSGNARHDRRINKIKELEGLACSARIVPAVLANTTEELKEKLSSLKGLVRCVQIDIMDGKFVPNSSISLTDVAELGFDYEYEAHLMVKNPEKYFEDSAKANVRRVVFHYEATDGVDAVLNEMSRFSFNKGIAINPDTPVRSIVPFLEKIDSVLIMSVNPGFSGQDFVSETLEKVKELRNLAPYKKIGIDGSINGSTIKKAHDAGVDYFVIGSGLFAAENIRQALFKMQILING
ncbi:hypothetical protein LCGC14_0843390 [marine sediment metagenome]|uniref:Ribulose-phosphate 3-epimerase n=1 Tax=marine sediment metagenome TaxID=412755 RepID=A0A0F9PCF0_9ZZZZ